MVDSDISENKTLKQNRQKEKKKQKRKVEERRKQRHNSFEIRLSRFLYFTSHTVESKQSAFLACQRPVFMRKYTKYVYGEEHPLVDCQILIANLCYVYKKLN